MADPSDGDSPLYRRAAALAGLILTACALPFLAYARARRTADSTPPVLDHAAPARDPEPSEHEVKRWEEFRTYAQNAYDRSQKRFNEADEKVGRFATMLGIINAAGIATLGPVINWALLQHSIRGWGILGGFSFVGIFAIRSFWLFISALDLVRAPRPPTTHDVLQFYSGENYYVDVLRAMGIQLLAAAEKSEAVVDTKYKKLHAGIKMLKITIFCFITTVAVYLPVIAFPDTPPLSSHPLTLQQQITIPAISPIIDNP